MSNSQPNRPVGLTSREGVRRGRVGREQPRVRQLESTREHGPCFAQQACRGHVNQTPARPRPAPVATHFWHAPDAAAEVAFWQKLLQQVARLVHAPLSAVHPPSLQGGRDGRRTRVGEGCLGGPAEEGDGGLLCVI